MAEHGRVPNFIYKSRQQAELSQGHSLPAHKLEYIYTVCLKKEQEHRQTSKKMNHLVRTEGLKIKFIKG